MKGKVGSLSGFILLFVMLFFSTSCYARELPDFTDLVKANSKAVVNISTTQKIKHRKLPKGMEIPDFPEDSPWGDLFRKFFGEEGGHP